MTPLELVTHFHQLAARQPQASAIWNPVRESWISFQEVTELASEWEERLASHDLRNRLVLIRISEGTSLLPLLLATWKCGAVTLILDSSLSPELEDRIALTERAALRISAEQIVSLEHPRSFRTPNLLLAKLTSGTTGVPKVLFFTAQEMCADGSQLMEAMGIHSEDRNFATIPLGHSYALGNIVFPFMLAGCPIAQGSTYLPHGIATQIEQTQSTVFPGTPPLFRALSRTHDPLELSSLRLCISAGARLDPHIARDFFQKFGRRIHNFYGSSETGGIAYDATGEAALDGSFIGTPIPGVTLERTASGHLSVSSPAVFTYGNRHRKKGVGRFRLSDKGTFGPNQEIQLAERHPGLLKIGGRRIITDELIRKLRAHPHISDFYITTISLDGKDRLAAAMETSENLSAKDIRQQLANDLPSPQLPRKIILLPQFPRTSRGKVDRQKLQQRLES
ncbi:class I adenylate-forming enzyme family protein [Puniceicoccus vermicola]|uniref:Acyl--CoA ligase n=1 Tax=Puniceicoccus vermicola TaxID=388746 RepID=A0A7X1E3J3_9BACT|nr:class I adenylate-forming enzyme family protein [Puniceicoccus vermicola]MBC2601039.1 acyl--CoA ligase [Puniceicoccus vermicola]